MPEEFGQIVVRSNPDGSTLRLKDVARVELGATSYSFDVRFKGKPASAIGIYQLPGSNAIAAAEGVRAKLDELARRLPKDLECEIGVDTTKAVTAGIHEILLTLFEALLLVILVVYIFLQGWRPTLIPLLAVPVSLIGTFIVFPLLGFSINTLSLFGLVLAIGLVVDDAIVVVEAVEHHIEEGMTPRDVPGAGDGTGLGAGDRHCPDPGGGVYPDGVHSGYYGQALPAVRRHHCHFGDLLSVQRPHLEPCSLRDDSEAAPAPQA